ncbi:uncharacterized protein ofcc1 [Gouania willdenowi]|uniref:uncharacterized protein ofcc1 n=1 Tax=Gouania willdenowi TaxID=441366 RepID=UPI0010563122|nr:orofacial cleft 1 candidate gene 1 protein [Gouania willdenowi]
MLILGVVALVLFLVALMGQENSHTCLTTLFQRTQTKGGSGSKQLGGMRVRICILHWHFTQEDFVSGSTISHFKSGAVPSLFPWNNFIVPPKRESAFERAQKRQLSRLKLLQHIHPQKLQQKALQQPKQKKSKSAEFLMDGEEEEEEVEEGEALVAMTGIENLAFDGEFSGPGSEIGGNEGARNYFDPPSTEQTDRRRRRTAGVSVEDELELTKVDENALYEKMTELLEDGVSVNIAGTLPASRDEEVLEVKAGDLLLYGGAGVGASGPGPSQACTTAKAQAEGSAGLREGTESTAQMSRSDWSIPHHSQQLRERVRPDMITLGSLSLQQHADQKGPWKTSEWAKRKRRLKAFFAGSEEQHLESDGGTAAVKPHPCLPSLRALGEGQEEASAKCEPSDSSSAASRPWWQGVGSDIPQPVEVHINCLRATRDKLPRGLYTVSVALHSQLGTPPLVWCTEKGTPAGITSTGPTNHGGHFYDINLDINQSLFMSLPATSEISPSMVLVFQLISVPGGNSHISTVHAWGAFPVCGPDLSLIQGRFKTPLLRGEPSIQTDQFKKIESLISSDLDHWLCNLYFQVKRLQPGSSEAKQCNSVKVKSPPGMPQSESEPDHLQNQLCPPPSHLQSHQLSHTGLSCRCVEATMVLSHQGSPLHLSAHSACSTSSLPGKEFCSGAISGNTGPRSEKAEGGILHKKKPIKKTNSCGPSVSGRGAPPPPPRQADKHKMPPSMEILSTEEMEEHKFSLQSAPTGSGSRAPCLSHRARLALRMLPSELGLPFPGQRRRRRRQQQQQQQQQQRHGSWRGLVPQLGLIMLLLALMWFVRLYLHYCSQWLYLQAIAVPVNKFRFHAHTVDLVYQSSLLHTREELALVVVGPLTLNAVTFLLVLIRCGCQQIFGSLPSFTSNLIMAQGVWTVLDPLAVFAVDAVLGRLTYSADTPVGDAAKLYWHFHQTDQLGAAGVVITLFLYGVLFLLSITILSVFLLRFHNDGRMLDVFQRLTAQEGAYFLPLDLELSNQELSYIVKKSEQWRGFNRERRKVLVKESIWTAEEPLNTDTDDEPQRHVIPIPVGESSTSVTIYTLYPSGLKQRYRTFLRQEDGAIIEVVGDVDGVEKSSLCQTCTVDHRVDKGGGSTLLQPRKRRQIFSRSNRVEPAGESGCGSGFDLTR